MKMGEFPGGPGVGTWCFHCGGPGSIPGEGTKILQATQCGKNGKTNINTMTIGSETTTEKQITDSSKLSGKRRTQNVVGPDMINTN